jgi:hypothetical protein
MHIRKFRSQTTARRTQRLASESAEERHAYRDAELDRDSIACCLVFARRGTPPY